MYICLSISAWKDGSNTPISHALQHAGFINEIDIPEELHDNTFHNFSEYELLIHGLIQYVF